MFHHQYARLECGGFSAHICAVAVPTCTVQNQPKFVPFELAKVLLKHPIKLFHIHTLVGTLVVQALVEIFLPISDSYLVHFHLVWHRRYQCQVKSKVKCEQSAPQAKVNVSHHLICIASDGALGADVGWWCFVYMLMLCVDVGAFGALPALCCSVVGCSAVVSLT